MQVFSDKMPKVPQKSIIPWTWLPAKAISLLALRGREYARDDAFSHRLLRYISKTASTLSEKVILPQPINVRTLRSDPSFLLPRMYGHCYWLCPVNEDVRWGMMSKKNGRANKDVTAFYSRRDQKRCKLIVQTINWELAVQRRDDDI